MTILKYVSLHGVPDVNTCAEVALTLQNHTAQSVTRSFHDCAANAISGAEGADYVPRTKWRDFCHAYFYRAEVALRA